MVHRVSAPSAAARAIGTLALLHVLAPAVAAANSNCWTIEDPDQRAYCRAVATNSAGQCTVITDYALRRTCVARVSGNPSRCSELRTKWERDECERGARR